MNQEARNALITITLLIGLYVIALMWLKIRLIRDGHSKEGESVRTFSFEANADGTVTRKTAVGGKVIAERTYSKEEQEYFNSQLKKFNKFEEGSTP